MNRRSLYRCRHDRRLAGVASGLAEFFDLDVSLVRILWVLSIFVGGIGIPLYIVMAIIVPLEPEYLAQPGSDGDPSDAGAAPDQTATGVHAGWQTAPVPHQHATGGGSGIGMTFFGALLIIFGTLALLDGYLPDWADSGRFLWPAFIVALGALLVITAVRRRPTEQ